MNQAQVQVFRLLLRNLQASLVDLSYGFSLKYPENPKESIVVPLILSIDDSLRSILSTFSEKTKCEVVHNYFSSDYLKIVKFKEKYEPILINDIQQLKNDFILFINQESSKISEAKSSDPSSEGGNFDILKDQINSKLKILDEPFSDISSPPFAIVDYFLSFKRIIPFDEKKINHLINRGNLYIYFFKFLRQLRLLENYKNRFEDGDMPSDYSKHLVEANYVPDQVQSTKVIMPLVKTQKTDPSIPNWSLLPKETNLPNLSGKGSGNVKGKFTGLKLNGLIDSPASSHTNHVQIDNKSDNKILDHNEKDSINSETIIEDNNGSNSNSQSVEPNNFNILSNEENINSNSINDNIDKKNDKNNNYDSNINNTDQSNSNKINIDTKNDNGIDSCGNQKSRLKGSRIGSTNSKNLSSLKLGSKSTLAMLQRVQPKSSPKKSENSNDNNETNNDNNCNDNSTNYNDCVNSNLNINSNTNIFSTIKGIPNLDDNNNDDMSSNDFLEDYKKGVIAINNSIYDDIKNDTNNNLENNSNCSNMEDGDSTLNRYMQMVQKLETSKQQLREWSQIIIARLQQKALLLQKENQLLRENLDIVSKQKSEIVEMYETQITELSEQSEFLRKENLKLKEKVSPNKSDDE